MKISISVEGEEHEFLSSLVASGTAANLSHAVRLCIEKYRREVK